MMEANKPFQWEHDTHQTDYHGAGLTGYTGLNYNSVAQLSVLPAMRAQVGHRGMYKAGLAVLADGSLLASPVDLQAPRVRTPFASGALDETWPVKLYKSTDGAQSWQPMAHSPLCGKEGSLSCLASGRLLFTSESLDGVAYSDDNGKSWILINFNTVREDPHQIVTTVRAPLIHPDGTISFLRCIGTPEAYAPKRHVSPKCKAWLIHSFDGGKTWKDRSDVRTWDDPFPLFTEVDFERMPDGRILACSRFEWLHPLKDKPLPYAPGSMPNDHAAGHMVLLESDDEGITWSQPREFLQYSEVQGQLTLLKDGRLLCTYTHYHLPFGVAAVVSDDLGRTWDFEHPFQLALSNATSTGWATTRQLPDESLVTLYALEPYHLEPHEKGRTVCHSVRWELPRR